MHAQKKSLHFLSEGEAHLKDLDIFLKDLDINKCLEMRKVSQRQAFQEGG